MEDVIDRYDKARAALEANPSPDGRMLLAACRDALLAVAREEVPALLVEFQALLRRVEELDLMRAWREAVVMRKGDVLVLRFDMALWDGEVEEIRKQAERAGVKVLVVCAEGMEVLRGETA